MVIPIIIFIILFLCLILRSLCWLSPHLLLICSPPFLDLQKAHPHLFELSAAQSYPKQEPPHRLWLWSCVYRDAFRKCAGFLNGQRLSSNFLSFPSTFPRNSFTTFTHSTTQNDLQVRDAQKMVPKGSSYHLGFFFLLGLSSLGSPLTIAIVKIACTNESHA